MTESSFSLVYEGLPYVPTNGESLKKLAGIKVDFPEYPTNTHFLLVKHEGEEDLPDNLEEIVGEVDIVLLENAGWSQEQQALQDKIAEGDPDALKEEASNIEGTFFKRINQAVFGSGKPVKFCDLPGSRKNLDKITQSNPFAITSPDVQPEQLMKGLNKWWLRDLNNRFYPRDKYILRSIYPTIDSALSVSGNLGRPVRTLFIIGAAHQALPYMLQRQALHQGVDDLHSVEVTRHGVTISEDADIYLDFLRGKPFDEKHLMTALLRALGANKITELEYSSVEGVSQAFTAFLGSRGVKAYMQT